MTSRSPLGSFGARALPWLPLAGAFAFAFAPLVLWDPAEISQVFPGGVEGWLFSSTAGSPWFVYGVSGWLVWQRRERLAASLGEPPATALAAVTGFVALALATGSALVDARHLLVMSVGASLVAAAALLGGRRAARAIALPAGFLLLAMPLPGVVTNEWVERLQLSTAGHALAILDAIGVSAVREGHLIHARGHVFHVIETCSGLRAIETLSMTAVVYWELFRRNRLQLLCLLLAAPFVAYAVNAVRVVSIVLVPYSRFAEVHTLQGMAALFGGVIGLGLIDRGLAEIEALLSRLRARDGRASAPPEAPQVAQPAPPRTRIAIATVGLLAIGLLDFALDPFQTARAPSGMTGLPWSAHDLQHAMRKRSDWRSERAPLEREFVGSVHFTERVDRLYRANGIEAEISLGLDDRRFPQWSGRSPRLPLPGPGYEPIGEEPAPSDAGLPPNARLLRVASRKEERLSLSFSLGDEGLWRETVRAFLALDRTPWRRIDPYVALRASVPVRREIDGYERALREIDLVARDVAASLAQLASPPHPGPADRTGNRP